MLLALQSARRLVVRCLAWSMIAFAIGLSPLVIGAINPATVVAAAPLDCAPVGVELIGGQLYYVENCFGYDVYRPL